MAIFISKIIQLEQVIIYNNNLNESLYLIIQSSTIIFRSGYVKL